MEGAIHTTARSIAQMRCSHTLRSISVPPAAIANVSSRIHTATKLYDLLSDLDTAAHTQMKNAN